MLRLVIACTGLALCASKVAAATDTILFSFPTDSSFSAGALPKAGLLQDAAGNLYGTASAGGAFACNCGVVFMLSPPAVEGMPWSETILHTFQGYTEAIPMMAQCRWPVSFSTAKAICMAPPCSVAPLRPARCSS
jgi:uncharacterized repeat protein (TIGR03803 family)